MPRAALPLNRKEDEFMFAGLLFAATLLGRKYRAASRNLLPICFGLFCCIVVLEFFGGRMVYGGNTTSFPEAFKAGEKIFAAECSTCHPHGGNVIDRSRPVLHSPKLKDFNTFLAWLRHPAESMPAFPTSEISDAQGKELYAYIMNVLEQPEKE
jgi:hypothetical protein